jgi:UDP-N-acetylmuramoyl-L-alanyl-D-glutamate--2,6-diaminopimelate ligase
MDSTMELRDAIAALAPSVTLPDGIEGPDLAVPIKGLTTNSQACQAGDVFIGMPGTRVDGGDFWQSAIAAGAIAAVVSEAAAAKAAATLATWPTDQPKPLVIGVPDVVAACGDLAAAFHGHPAQRLQLVGVTGTNGKTTTTQLVEFFLAAGDRQPALLGTLVVRWPGFEQTAVHTTPFAVDLQGQLAGALAAGADSAVMEVSSHALDQRRVKNCPFEVAVFTNLTQDHLDYHGTMEAYFEAKARLFREPYLAGRAIVNGDDSYGQRLVAELPRDRVWTYSLADGSADLHLRGLTYGLDGVSGEIVTPEGSAPFQSPLVGQFNLQNLLAAVGAGLHLGVPLDAMVAALPQFPGVPGRMQRVTVPDGARSQDISVIVDYAHTPDSLENALRAARPFVERQLICVFGCGGDRDRTKRPIMGRIGAELADWAIVTSDNPRTEDPQRILDDVVADIPEGARVLVEGDRAAAIRLAIAQAQAGDCVLIAGKGHEDYQILGTEKIHFDDREQAAAALTVRLSA